jgi:two-component system nitrogen regulation response regulator GlnG
VGGHGRRLLVIDDDEPICRLIRRIFGPEGFEVIVAESGEAGLERVASDSPDVVILDLQLPGIDGLQVLEKLRQSHPDLPVVLLTADTDVKTAVRATQLGAFDYRTKPIDHDEILVVIQRALETRVLKAEVEELRRKVDAAGTMAVQMGPSQETRAVIDQVRLVAASTFTVLILGETGTGKELVAQAIQRQSDRKHKPFVALDCGAIPETLLESELFGHEKGAFTGAERRKEGRFQLAEGGTLFLDEVGNLPPPLQAKLLRVLESRQVQPVGAAKATTMDVRFVAATNHDLQERAAKGQFRTDLYFRLAQYTIALPPLRKRVDDIVYLAQRFLEEAAIELRRPVQGIAPDALALLQKHSWPGNVRELRNLVRQAVLESDELMIRREVVRKLLGKAAKAASIAPTMAAPPRSLREIASSAAKDAELRAIRDALQTARGNKSQAARALRTDYKTLHVKMKQLGIRGRDFGP